MIDKFAGYKTQVRVLEKKLKEMDHSKLNPTKVKELTEAIQNLKDIIKEKEDKKIERRKKKEEASKAAPVESPKSEASTQPTEVVKESLTTPTEVTKESTVEKFAIDSKVEPIRGTPGSWGVIIREAGTNGDPLCYVKWMEGTLKTAHGDYGAYYPSDLKLKVEKEAVSTDYVPREQVYNLEADLKGSYERMIADLQEEIQTAKDKAEYAWVGRLEEKLADVKKTYDEKYGKTAEDENGSGGTNKLKVVDFTPAHDKDPQEKSTGYGGDRSMGWQTSPKSDESSLPLESSLKEASLDKQAIHITVGEKLFVVTPLAKTADNEYQYDVTIGANNQKLFKITSKDEMGQEHLTYVIGKELGNTKEAKNKCVICNLEFDSWPEYDAHKKEKHSPKVAKLTSNLAFLKKGSFVSILDVDNNKKQIKFAALDNSLRGWAPQSKFAAFGDIEQKFMDHEGHKDEVFAESGNELLVSCPQGTTNITWRAIEAPPATPESLNPDVTAATDKEAAGCSQCEMLRINGIPTHETGCPVNRKVRDCDICGYPLTNDPEDHNHDVEASLNKEAHIRYEDGKWVIYSHDYKKKLGTYDSKEAAEKRLKQIEYFKHQGSLHPLSKKEANVMETKCEECGKELGPEVFLSKWPVCRACTKKRHEKAVGKRADQEISLEQQVQSFRDRMNAVTERLANPPSKTADLETTQDLSNVDVKDLSDAILHAIDLLESKVGENVSADPELHPMLEDLENKVFEIETKLGIKPTLSEHEKLEPEHKQFVEEEVEKESSVEVKSDNVNTPPSTLPPAGFRYAWDPKNQTWILVQISDAPGGGY